MGFVCIYTRNPRLKACALHIYMHSENAQNYLSVILFDNLVHSLYDVPP